MTASPPAGAPLAVRFWGAAARGSCAITPATRAATRSARCLLRITHLFYSKVKAYTLLAFRYLPVVRRRPALGRDRTIATVETPHADRRIGPHHGLLGQDALSLTFAGAYRGIEVFVIGTPRRAGRPSRLPACPA